MKALPLDEKSPSFPIIKTSLSPSIPVSAQKDGVLFGRVLSPEDQVYVRQLTTYSISQLQKEPVEITKESDKIGTEIEALAVRNYRSFIETSQALSQAHNAIIKMDSSLKELVSHVPKFIQSVDAFSKDSKSLRDSQRLNRIISEHQTELVELMELPQLMETCVRNALYEEALDVEAYASSLAVRCPDISLLQDLVRDMEGTVRTLFAQLLDKLRSPIQLSTCLRVVSYLRRLNILSESELRAEFLRSRTAWLTGVLESAGSEDGGAEYLSKYIDSCQVHLREVVIQYRAIFVDDNSTAEEDEDRGLLCFWVNARILILVSTIKRVLGSITDGAMVANILEQAMYCGLSLARVGSDFRSLLPAIFEERMFQIVGSILESSKNQFLYSLEEYEWHINGDDLSRLGIPTGGKLVEYPSLSTLANAFVDAANTLRHCAALSLCARVTKKAEHMLSWVAAHFQNLQLGWQDTVPRGHLLDLARAFSNHLLPFVAKLLKDVFNQKQELLDTNLILAPLQGLFEEEKAAEQREKALRDTLLEEQRQKEEKAEQREKALRDARLEEQRQKAETKEQDQGLTETREQLGGQENIAVEPASEPEIALTSPPFAISLAETDTAAGP
jgi:hypothetical protein